MAIPPVITAPMIAHVIANLDIALLKEIAAIKINSINLEFLNTQAFNIVNINKNKKLMSGAKD